jgi:PAS domain S-box-containing protein
MRLRVRDKLSGQDKDLAQAHLAAIVSSSDDAIISKDLQGIIVSWNRGAEALFGYTAQEAIGRPITMLIPETRLDEETKILERIRRGDLVNHYQTIRRRKDGTLIEVSLTVSPIRNSAGEIVGASKIARDITEEKKAGRELAETARRLREAQVELEKHAADLERTVAERTAELRATVGDLEAFSYSISHDLRAPLRAMQGFAQLLQENYGQQLDVEGRMWLDKISRAGTRLNQLIEDVLSYSRVGRADVMLEPNSLDKLVPRVIEEYPNILEGNPEITVQRPLQPVIGSETLLMQCIANLLGNAVKFVPPGTRPRVNVRTEPRNGAVRLWVEDNGVGIPETEHRQIFRLFARGVTNAQVDGTGVGLAVVQRAVSRMHGSVGVESQVGQGSRFWIELPGAP